MTDFKTKKLCKVSANATVPRIKLKAEKQVGLAFFLCRLSLSLLLISGCDQKAIIPPPADAALSEGGRATAVSDCKRGSEELKE